MLGQSKFLRNYFHRSPLIIHIVNLMQGSSIVKDRLLFLFEIVAYYNS